MKLSSPDNAAIPHHSSMRYQFEPMQTAPVAKVDPLGDRRPCDIKINLDGDHGNQSVGCSLPCGPSGALRSPIPGTLWGSEMCWNQLVLPGANLFMGVLSRLLERPCGALPKILRPGDSVLFPCRYSSPLPARLSDALAFHMQSPLCLGMGELGLDTGSPREERILRLQLDWALANLPEEKRIGIHTPRREKERVTLQTLALLEDYPSLQSRVLVDHVTPATWTFLQKTPYMMGITLQDGKTSLPSFLQFMAGHGHNVDRIMLNSDGAKSLSLPFLQFLGDTECLDTESRQALLRGNAARFFALDL